MNDSEGKRFDSNRTSRYHIISLHTHARHTKRPGPNEPTADDEKANDDDDDGSGYATMKERMRKTEKKNISKCKCLMQNN